MTGLIKNWKTDPKKENDGIAIEYDANDDGTIPTFYVRRVASTEHVKVQNRIFSDFRTHQRLKLIPAEKNIELTTQAFAEGCIVKWENIQDENGQPIEFTPENAKVLLLSMPDLYYDLSSKASDKDNYRTDSLESSAKN